MLVLSRKKNEQIIIQFGDQTVAIRVLSVMGDRVRIGVTAPREVVVHRDEVARRINAWNHDFDDVLVAPQ